MWSVKFSPVDQVRNRTNSQLSGVVMCDSSDLQCVATASADGTVKLWAVGDFSCIKTFEGHVASVLKAIFLPRGMQLVSRCVCHTLHVSCYEHVHRVLYVTACSGSDGLVKVWTIRTNECVATLDRHTEKVTCISLNPSSMNHTVFSLRYGPWHAPPIVWCWCLEVQTLSSASGRQATCSLHWGNHVCCYGDHMLLW